LRLLREHRLLKNIIACFTFLIDADDIESSFLNKAARSASVKQPEKRTFFGGAIASCKAYLRRE
jgi:hypothetical protein